MKEKKLSNFITRPYSPKLSCSSNDKYLRRKSNKRERIESKTWRISANKSKFHPKKKIPREYSMSSNFNLK